MKNKNWVYKFYYYSNIIVNRLFLGVFSFDGYISFLY